MEGLRPYCNEDRSIGLLSQILGDYEGILLRRKIPLVCIVNDNNDLPFSPTNNVTQRTG